TKRARRQNHRGGCDAAPVEKFNTTYAAGDKENLCDFGLLDKKIRRAFQHPTHDVSVSCLIRLGAGRPHGRPAARVEQAKLYPGFISSDPHDAAQCIDLTYRSEEHTSELQSRVE